MSSTVSKKRKFGIPSSLGKGLTDTIKLAENHVSEFKNVVIPISFIEPDPNNPRKINLTIDEIKSGECIKDNAYELKQQEKESLTELSWSIQKKGLINPITVYQQGNKYRLVAGERRYLASIIANKEDIEARVYKTKPSDKDLILVQWIENTAREDLSLSDRMANIEAIIRHFSEDLGNSNVGVDMLMKVTGLSQANAYRYVAILKNSALRDCIANKSVKSFKTASLLASTKSKQGLDEILRLSEKEGVSIEQALKVFKSKKKSKQAAITSKVERRGRGGSSINLGKVHHASVVKVLVDALVATPMHSHYKAMFLNVNWEDSKEVAQSFKQLLLALDKEA